MPSLVDVVNNALDLIGETAIAALNDPDRKSAICNRQQASVLPALLTKVKWNFNYTRKLLAADAAVPEGSTFRYAYTLPADYLKVYGIGGDWRGSGMPDSNLFWSVEGGKILTDAAPPLTVHYGRLIDDPNRWQSSFRLAFECLLANRLAHAIPNSSVDAKELFTEYRAHLSDATSEDGLEHGSATPYDSPDLLEVREGIFSGNISFTSPSGTPTTPTTTGVPFGYVPFGLGTTVALGSDGMLTWDNGNKSLHIGTAPFVPTVNYVGGGALQNLLLTNGQVGSPLTTTAGLAVIGKISDVNNDTASNPALFASHIKYSTGMNNNATAIYGETEDRTGTLGTFIEAIRGNAILTQGADGHADGLVASAQTLAGIGYRYLIGAEGEVINNGGVNAPVIFTNQKFATGFLATANGDALNDAGFMTNPFSAAAARFRVGFLVTESSLDATTGAGFMDIGTHAHGLDLSKGAFSQAAILLANNSPIRAKSADNMTDYNICFVNPSNELVLGFDATNILLQSEVGTALASFTVTMATNETAMLVRLNTGGVYDIKRVEVGANDSGGTNYRMLRVGNG